MCLNVSSLQERTNIYSRMHAHQVRDAQSPEFLLSRELCENDILPSDIRLVTVWSQCLLMPYISLVSGEHFPET